MTAHAASSMFGRIVATTLAAPPVLLAYTAFSITVTVGDFILLPLAPRSFRAGLVPYTGWLVSGGYSVTIAFAIALIFERRWRPALRFFGVAVLLSLGQISPGIYQASQVGREDFGNPYLTISPWQPVWSVLVPALWIAAFYTPGMNRHCRESQGPPTA